MSFWPSHHTAPILCTAFLHCNSYHFALYMPETRGALLESIQEAFKTPTLKSRARQFRQHAFRFRSSEESHDQATRPGSLGVELPDTGISDFTRRVYVCLKSYVFTKEYDAIADHHRFSGRSRVVTLSTTACVSIEALTP